MDAQAAANAVACSVLVEMSPQSTQEARSQASKYYNGFLHSTPPTELCQVGFLLTTHSDPAVVRVGLQCVEHVAKFGWQDLTERELVKEKLFVIMRSEFISEQTPSFLQEAFARVIVEIAKREWPQLWPNLFPQLFEIASSSDLALKVLRRMVEDVATLQTVDCHERRRELSQSLTAIAPEVIGTFFRVLIESVRQYHVTATPVFHRRAQACLGCLLPYIEWTNPSIFAKHNMIPTLLALLPDFYFQLNAAECILQLVERKPAKKEDRFEIPNICLSDESFAHFLQATATTQPNIHDFLRKLGDILITLAPSVIYGKVKVENFLQGCEKLAAREEAVAVLQSTSAINHYLKVLEKDHPNSLSPDELNRFKTEVDQCLIRLVGLILKKFVSAPPNSIEREEMGRLKIEYSSLLRSVGKRIPSLYNEVHQWLRNSLGGPSSSVQNFQWETLALVVDAVSSSVSEHDEGTVKIGLADLEMCLAKFIAEPSLELKSLILSLLSALFVFLHLAKKRNEFSEAHHKIMISIFESLFKCFQYEESANTRDIRRHSASLLIKLASKYADLMATGFDYIHSTAASMAATITTMEQNSVLEALMLISNVWNDVEKQSAFLRTLFVAKDWQEVSAIVESPQSLISILPETVFQSKRALLLRNFQILFSSLKRIKKTKHSNSNLVLQPNGNNAVVNGVASPENDSSHAAFDHVCPLIPVVLKLVKSIHSFSEIPELKYILDLSEGERVSVLGIHGHFMPNEIPAASESEKGRTHQERVKTVILSLQEIAYGILGESCHVLGPKFYTIPHLGDAYVGFVGHNSHFLNDFRLRGIIRNVFKPLLLSCPGSLAPKVVIPFAQKFFPFASERLANRWNVIETAKVTEAEGEEEKEVVENSSLRLLTKEYVELLARLLEKQVGGSTGNTEGLSQGDMEMDNEVEGGGTGGAVCSELGELGIQLITDPICFPSIINTLVSCICWDDTGACLRASRCILMIWDRIAPQIEIVKGTFATVLRGVCVWEESEANLDLLLRIMDACFRTYCSTDPQFAQMLKDWGAPEPEIQKLVGLCQLPKNEKKRKDLLRKLVHNNPALEHNKSPKSQWLKGLPQLNINSSTAKDKIRQSSPDIDLTECFSVLHNVVSS